MKLGIQTSTFDKEGYGRWGENTYEKLGEHGYTCSDFAMADTESVIYTGTREESDRVLLHEKELADRAGIEIFQTHGPWRYPPMDLTEEDRNERMEKMKMSIRATALLGSKNWVIHPLMPYGTNDIGSGNEEKTLEINVAFMRELVKTAREYDVTICYENMPMHNFSLAKPDDVLKVARIIDDDHFKICLDTGHVSVFNELSVGDEIRKLGSEIRTLHIHDNTYCCDLHMMPYFGIIDWEDFAKSIKDINFSGCLSLETIPSRKLSDGVFEGMCIQLSNILKEISAKT